MFFSTRTTLLYQWTCRINRVGSVMPPYQRGACRTNRVYRLVVLAARARYYRASMELDVAGLGFCCQDDLLLLSEIPEAEGRANVLGRAAQGGGMVATAIVAVARLGGRAGYLAKVGDDATGELILDGFRQEGVDVSRAVVQPGATSHATIVLVDRRNGARAFLAMRGTAQDILPGELDRDYIAATKILHISDSTPAAVQAAAWAREAGREVCFDGTHFHPSMFPLLRHVTYLIVSRFFAAEVMAHLEGLPPGRASVAYATLHELDAPVHHGGGEVPTLHGDALLAAAVRLQDFGPPVVVVTEGEHGCWCASPDGSFHTPAFPVDPVDTTGAGDVFHGAFLLARTCGWDLRQALRFASAAASLKCRALGGRAGIPTFDETVALMNAGR